MAKKTRVVVVGAGFAGVQATRALVRGAPNCSMTLIDRNDYSTMLPALPDVFSGRVRRESICRPLRDTFPRGVNLVRDEVKSIDTEQREVVGGDGRYRYDYLVVTNGSKPQFFGFTPERGAVYTVDSFAGAQRLRSALVESLGKRTPATLVIVGGGYTGIETAACVRSGVSGSDIDLRIVIVEKSNGLLPFLSGKERNRIESYLSESNVDVRTGVSLDRLLDETAYLSDGTEIEGAIVCWTAGMCAAADSVTGAVERTRDGRFHVDEFLRVEHCENVFAAGDAAALSQDESVLRRAVNFSFYSGRCAGRNVVAALRNRSLKRFKPVDLGWVIPLGSMSVGRVFGPLRVGGRFGLRLHYLMSGFRHFGARESWEFYKTAFHLNRAPDKPLS